MNPETMTDEEILEALNQPQDITPVNTENNAYSSLSDEDIMKAIGTPNINPTGFTADANLPQEAQQQREDSSGIGGAGIQAAAGRILNELPFGARIGSAVTGKSVSDIKSLLQDVGNPAYPSQSEKYGGAIGQAVGMMPGFEVAGGAAKLLPGASRLAQALKTGAIYSGTMADVNNRQNEAIGSPERQSRLLEAVKGGATMGVLSKLGEFGAQLMPRQLDKFIGKQGTERIASALAQGGPAYLMPGTPEEKLSNAIFYGMQGAISPAQRKQDIGIKQQVERMRTAAFDFMKQNKIFPKLKTVSMESLQEHQGKIADEFVKLYEDNRDLVKQGGLNDPIQMTDALNKRIKSQWDKMAEIEDKAAMAQENAIRQAGGIVSPENSPRMKFLMTPRAVAVEVGKVIKQIPKIERGSDWAKTAEAIKKELDWLNSKIGPMSSKDVDARIKAYNEDLKKYYNAPTEKSSNVAKAIVADAMRNAHEKFLESLDSSAGKEWRNVRREMGRTLQLRDIMLKKAQKYIDPDQPQSWTDNISGVLDKLKGGASNVSIGAKAASGNVLGAGKDILLKYTQKRLQKEMSSYSKMFNEMRKAEAMRTLNQQISSMTSKTGRGIESLGSKGSADLIPGNETGGRSFNNIKFPKIIRDYLLDEYSGGDEFGKKVIDITNKGISSKEDADFIRETILGTDAGSGGVLEERANYNEPGAKILLRNIRKFQQQLKNKSFNQPTPAKGKTVEIGQKAYFKKNDPTFAGHWGEVKGFGEKGNVIIGGGSLTHEIEIPIRHLEFYKGKSGSAKSNLVSGAAALTGLGVMASKLNKEEKKPIISGKVSSYGYDFKKEHLNERTANNEKFEPNALTAAMWDVPFGTKVKVTDKKTGKSVVVRINDRGPKRSLNRPIDLSKGAMKALGYDKPSLIDADVEIIGK